jgi:hypothetical protein
MNLAMRTASIVVLLVALALAGCGGGGGGGGSDGTSGSGVSGSGSQTAAFIVTYDSNGATSGTVPEDTAGYAQGQSVTVLGNTGSLAKSGCAFAGWNTQADGSGKDVTPGSTLTMGTASIVLHAKWTYTASRKIMFIHHSSGYNWLATGNGNLGTALNAKGYYVTDSYYGWDADPSDGVITGDYTDTKDWTSWFNDAIMPHVYANNYLSPAYANAIANPGGENEIIMFKSCFPMSEVDENIPPYSKGIDDEKAIYNSLKPYFAAHQDKLFILVTPPGVTNVSSYLLTKQLCDWLVDTSTGWLSDYPGKNVYVFDLYAVLSEVNSHHRHVNGVTEHVYAADYDGESPYHYYVDHYDDHPTAAGNQKATEEFMSLLEYWYYTWKQ